MVAMSVSSWYFAKSKSAVGSLTVVASVGKTFVYHIGTAAFGGLIVAIVEVSQSSWDTVLCWPGTKTWPEGRGREASPDEAIPLDGYLPTYNPWNEREFRAL